MWKLVVFSSVLLITGCASTIQSASTTEAYKKYENHNYKRTLELIARAENTRSTTPEMEAELTYLKALTHEKLGQHDTAVTLYEYLKEQHADTQYGYLANKRLSTSF